MNEAEKTIRGKQLFPVLREPRWHVSPAPNARSADVVFLPSPLRGRGVGGEGARDLRRRCHHELRRRLFSLGTACLISCLAITIPNSAVAESMKQTDAETGWTVYTATQGKTRIRLVPEAGCNVYSLEYAGREILKQPKSLRELRGVGSGTPILYPTPNRVRGAQFSFSGKTYHFEANNGTNFIHGLVHSATWELVKIEEAAGLTTLHCQLEFQPGTEWFKHFPLRHVLKLAIGLSDGRVRFTYTVDNTAGDQPVPFGIALHPWFLYLGKREETFLTVPATHWMEAEQLLPTGKLVELTGTKFDARQPKSLGGLVIDDVYFGMVPRQPTVIDYRDRQFQISLSTSADFTHLVVYTPEQLWFCVENQTCSTDAHNLAAKGLTKESHLQIVEPGKTQTGYVEFQVHQD